MVEESVVALYDTTLRDGTQAEGISLSVEDKLKITRLLDRLGVHYVEGGWPGSNPKSAEYFQRVQTLDLAQVRVAAFGSTCRVGSTPGEDPNIRALLEADTPVVAIVGKSWMLHVEDVLGTTAQENLRIIGESVAYVKGFSREVVYDAEHFFDGYKADPEYAIDTLRAAVRGERTRWCCATPMEAPCHGRLRGSRSRCELSSRGPEARPLSAWASMLTMTVSWPWQTVWRRSAGVLPTCRAP